jgi:hypothetical protein
VVAALSSRGLGRGPLKAQTRVRIPLALWMERRGFAALHGWTALRADRVERRGFAALHGWTALRAGRVERRGFAALHRWTALRAGREAVLGPIVYRLGRHPFTVQRGVRFPLGLLSGLIDNQFGYKAGVQREGVPTLTPVVGAVAQFG